MVRIKYSDLAFDHIVVFREEDTIYACARENGKDTNGNDTNGSGKNGNGHTRLFLVFGKEGRVYARNGLAHSWEVLGESDATKVRDSIHKAINQGITIYHFNGSSQTVTGQVIPDTGKFNPA